MNLLLDTQAILLASQDNLPEPSRGILSSPSHRIFHSLVSYWEIGIKAARGTLRLEIPLSELLGLVESELGAEQVPLGIKAIEAATRFPYHHKDPFDRILAGQALASGCSIVSGDKIFEKYGCKRVW